MSEPQPQDLKHNHERAFEIVEVDTARNTMLIEVHRGIAGALANQLKACPDERKGARIVRKLGFEVAKAGNILYGSATPAEQAEYADVIVEGSEADAA